METKEIYYYYVPREMEQEENLNEQKGLFQTHHTIKESTVETQLKKFYFHPSFISFKIL